MSPTASTRRARLGIGRRGRAWPTCSTQGTRPELKGRRAPFATARGVTRRVAWRRSRASWRPLTHLETTQPEGAGAHAAEPRPARQVRMTRRTLTQESPCCSREGPRHTPSLSARDTCSPCGGGTLAGLAGWRAAGNAVRAAATSPPWVATSRRRRARDRHNVAADGQGQSSGSPGPPGPQESRGDGKVIGSARAAPPCRFLSQRSLPLRRRPRPQQ